MMKGLRMMAGFIRRDFLIQSSYRAVFVLQAVGVVASTFIWYYIARIVNPSSATRGLEGLDYFSYLLFGIALHRYLTVALTSYSTRIRGEQLTGTLEAMLVTAAGPGAIVLSSAVWDFVAASVQAMGFIVVGWALFHVPIHFGNLPACVLILILTSLAFSGIGVMAGSLVLYFKRGEPITFVVSSVSALLGGVFYPPEDMPRWLELGSRALPITWSLRGVRRALLKESTFYDVLPEIQALLVFALALLPLGLLVFRLAVKRARAEGSLVEY